MCSIKVLKYIKKNLKNNKLIIIKYYDFNFKLKEIRGRCTQIILSTKKEKTFINLWTTLLKEKVFFKINLLTPFLYSIEYSTGEDIILLYKKG